jgi:cytochrome c553
MYDMKKSITNKVNETKKHKVMKKLGNQITKNLDFSNTSNISEFYKSRRINSPNQKNCVNSSRK